MPENLGGWIVAAIVAAAWTTIVVLVDRHARGKAKGTREERRRD